MKRVLLVVLGICIYSSFATKFYVDGNAGNDNNPGTFAKPWKTVDRVNNHNSPNGFLPGDSILFKRGIIYTTSNYDEVQMTDGSGGGGHSHHDLVAILSPNGNGDPGNPIFVSAYGAGTNPVIEFNDDDPDIALGGVVLFNQDHWVIENLEIRDSDLTGMLQNFRWGIYLKYGVPSTGSEQDHGSVIIRNNYIHDIFSSTTHEPNRAWGPNIYSCAAIFVSVDTENRSSGRNNCLNNLLIENNVIENFHGEGIYFSGQKDPNHGTPGNMNWDNLSTNVVIRGNNIKNVCDGIVLEGVEDALVEKNLLDEAGGTATKPAIGGAVVPTDHTAATGAIWQINSRGGIYQYNEVKNTKKSPGDGFALHTDIGASGITIFQYNYTHDNENACFVETWSHDEDDLVSGSPRSIFRYNISYNDGNGIDGNNGSAVEDPIYLNLGGTEFYNNIIIHNNEIVFDNAQPLAHPPYIANNNIRNNVFISPEIRSESINGLVNIFNNNSYFNPFPPSGSTGEMPELGYLLSTRPIDANAILTNPQFVNGFTFNSVDDFKLQKDSPLIGAGLNITNNGGRDFWGTSLYSNARPEVGAYEEPADITPAINLLLD